MFAISSKPIHPSTLKKRLTTRSTGACVDFEGIVRDHSEGRKVKALDYEAMEPLCLKEAERILKETFAAFKIIKADCVHRTGKLKIGDIAVWVGVTASHRDDAFKACRYIIDEIKGRLPIWKKEHYANGNSGWVNCGSPKGMKVRQSKIRGK